MEFDEDSFFRELPKKPSKIHSFVLLLLMVVNVAALLIAAGVKQWFHWCWFDFGLWHVETWKHQLSSRAGSDNTYQSVADNVCTGDYKHLMNNACDNFCDDFHKIWGASIIMMVFLAFALLLIVVNMGMFLGELCGKRGRYSLALILPCLPWFAFMTGLIFYMGFANVYGLHKPFNHDQEVSTGDGLIAAYVAIATLAIPPLYRMFTLQPNSSSVHK
jgi:hypothetical protein